MSKLVIDLFVYAGEKDILDIRLHELNDVISFFVISESNRTQTGIPKPYYFEEQKEYFKEFLHKIVYLKVDSNLNGIGIADWSHEFRVRDSLRRCSIELDKLGVDISQSCYFCLSDVDEISRKEVIQDLIDKNVEITVINHYFISYFLNYYSRFREPHGWYGTVLFRLPSVLDIQNTDIQHIRNIKDKLPKTGKIGEGWHFSSIGGFDRVWAKAKNNIEPHQKSFHTQENKEIYRKQFEKHVIQDKYFWFVDDWNNKSIKLDKLPLNMLPLTVQENLDKYRNLIL